MWTNHEVNPISTEFASIIEMAGEVLNHNKAINELAAVGQSVIEDPAS